MYPNINKTMQALRLSNYLITQQYLECVLLRVAFNLHSMRLQNKYFIKYTWQKLYI